jgi:hypothetical protein
MDRREGEWIKKEAERKGDGMDGENASGWLTLAAYV